jgi:periplasmic protein TonB
MRNNTDETPEPQHETTQSALGRCLVEGDAATKSRDRRRRGEALGISFAIESAVLALLIVVPLMTSVAQPDLNSTLYVPIAFGGSRASSEPQRPPSAIHRFEKSHAHSFTFAMNPTTQRPAPHSEEEPDTSTSGADPLGSMYPPEGVSIVGLLPTDPSAHRPTEIKKPEEKRLVRVSEPMQQAQLITRIVPRYPPLAIQTRTEGTVLLHAIISVDGRITALEVVSGQPLLVQAAVDAVRQWRYRPTYLNGEAVEVETSITVIFRLGQ